MNYNLKNTFKRIRGIKFYKSQVILGYDNGELFVDSNKISDDVDTVSSSLRIYLHYLFFDKNDISCVYDFDTKIVIQTGDFRVYTESIVDNEFLGTYGGLFINGKYSWHTGKYDFDKKKILMDFPLLQDVPIICFLGVNDLIVSPKQMTLSYYDLKKNGYLWQTDLSGRKYLDIWQEEKEVKIQRIIGIYENQLLVVFSNDELISLDTNTGEVLWETKDFIKINLPDRRSISQFRFVYWHIENGKMYQLDGNVYYSIDLYSQKVEILWKDEKQENFITITHKTYTTEYIYFTGSYNQLLQPHLVGVFNRKLLKVEWVHDINLSIDPKMGYPPSLNQPPQVSENKLYVLDTGGTLHIFEKAQNA
ncbi:MAG: hypothetical protein U5N85_22430 [Arcicella sp.]|nr:hypothetical protein [Arcicella sp.]